MEQIDWSKAPTDATHWEAETDSVSASWMKLAKGEWFFWDEDKWYSAGSVNMERSEHMVPRPATWNGEGLPPVGTVCDVLDGSDQYVSGTVVAHVTAEGTPQAVIQCAVDWFAGNEEDFRPIRTPEQIAADELCEAIVEHYGVPKMSEHYIGLARALYDAGYRKVYPSK